MNRQVVHPNAGGVEHGVADRGGRADRAEDRPPLRKQAHLRRQIEGFGMDDLDAVALAINNRPRKSLGWKTPTEVFTEQLQLLEQDGVATTG